MSDNDTEQSHAAASKSKEGDSDSFEDASDNLALKNIKTVLLKLLSQPGLGRIYPDPKN